MIMGRNQDLRSKSRLRNTTKISHLKKMMHACCGNCRHRVYWSTQKVSRCGKTDEVITNNRKRLDTCPIMDDWMDVYQAAIGEMDIKNAPMIR